MKRLRRSLIAYLFAIVSLLTWLSASFFSWYEFQEISSALVMGSCVVGMVQWFKPAARSMRDGQDYADFFAFSIFQILFFMSVQRLWGNLLRWTGRPDYLVYSPVTGIIMIMGAFSVFLMILARGTEGGRVPGENITRAIVALILSGIIAATTLILFSDRIDELGRVDASPWGAPGIEAVVSRRPIAK
ncbi:hypothetical protein HFO09_23110 [Rhizobium laguerreae]|uniref:hypothetical protein n=1 Tax=Rhizobium laguerreae TaxID=1076926 RepID=UPI001C92B465|nr:hypothetical protein [Rhizobium laguerreae]MBY3257046.1 hypothetical protein [Rhizobium laguerreae]MBY3282407.1 hypothetical protein [Rhizobium laguerreae]MBY3291934.1 hypothetical protein [Rhizobium laguerreae]